MTFANVSASELDSETVGVVCQLAELLRAQVNSAGGSADCQPCQKVTRNDSREVVDHDGKSGTVHDTLEEGKNGFTVVSHSKGEVA